MRGSAREVRWRILLQRGPRAAGAAPVRQYNPATESATEVGRAATVPGGSLMSSFALRWRRAAAAAAFAITALAGANAGGRRSLCSARRVLVGLRQHQARRAASRKPSSARPTTRPRAAARSSAWHCAAPARRTRSSCAPTSPRGQPRLGQLGGAHLQRLGHRVGQASANLIRLSINGGGFSGSMAVTTTGRSQVDLGLDPGLRAARRERQPAPRLSSV